MQHALTAERDAAVVLAAVVTRLLLLWSVSQVCWLVADWGPADTAMVLGALLPLAVVLVLCAGQRRLLCWLEERAPPAPVAPPGTGILTVGLPLLAVVLVVRSLVLSASDVLQAVRFDYVPVAWREAPRLGLALALLVAAPALTRAFARWNAPRATDRGGDGPAPA